MMFSYFLYSLMDPNVYYIIYFNTNALRKAKILCNFGLFECIGLTMIKVSIENWRHLTCNCMLI